jgi:hypothetical protein
MRTDCLKAFRFQQLVSGIQNVAPGLLASWPPRAPWPDLYLGVFHVYQH